EAHRGSLADAAATAQGGRLQDRADESQNQRADAARIRRGICQGHEAADGKRASSIERGADHVLEVAQRGCREHATAATPPLPRSSKKKHPRSRSTGEKQHDQPVLEAVGCLSLPPNPRAESVAPWRPQCQRAAAKRVAS